MRNTVAVFLPIAGLAILAGCAGNGQNPAAAPPTTPTAATEPSLFALAPAGYLPPSVATGRSMEARAADFDQDGDIDLLIAREASPNILLVNDGGGRFADESADRLPQDVRDSEDIAVADFDGDGDLDVFIACEDEVAGGAARPKHAYHRNDGRGFFTDASSAVPVRTTANSVAAGDIDRDGDIDLVLGNAGTESVLLNDGRGVFSDGTAARMPGSADVTQDVLLGDVDRDGDLDLVVANESNGPNLLYRNDGRGFFQLAPDAVPLRAAPEATRNADLGDVDGDGDLDLVFGNVGFGGAEPRSRLLLNDGAGRFADATADRLPPIVAPAMDAEFVDLDGDGDLDLVTVPFPAASYRAFVNDGTGRFGEATARFFPANLGGQAVEVEAADFDRNGRVDLYIATYVESSDVLLLAR